MACGAKALGVAKTKCREEAAKVSEQVTQNGRGGKMLCLKYVRVNQPFGAQ